MSYHVFPSLCFSYVGNENLPLDNKPVYISIICETNTLSLFDASQAA